MDTTEKSIESIKNGVATTGLVVAATVGIITICGLLFVGTLGYVVKKSFS